MGKFTLNGIIAASILTSSCIPAADRDISQHLVIKGLGSRSSGSPPNVEQMEQDFVDPRELKFAIRDLNLNGKDELVANYKGRDYLVKYDTKSSSIQLIPYERKIEVIEKTP